MTENREYIYKLRVCDLLIPGTHDSCCNKLIFDKIPSVRDPLLKIPINKVTKKFITNWAVTQSKTVTEQLETGVRYLDIRVCVDPNENKFYAFHTFYICPLQDILNEIYNYVCSRKGEAVFVTFYDYFYKQGLDQTQMDEYRSLLTDFINSIIGTRIHETDPFTKIEDMILSGKRIMILPESIMKGEWINTDSIKEKKKRIQEGLELYVKESKHIRELSWTLTPQTSTVVKSVLGFRPKSIKEMSARMNPLAKDFISGLAKETKSKLNIISFDFWDESINIIDLCLEEMKKRSIRIY